jgi:UDP-N-acetylmuramoyl-L-alanyl-D-glutamate--2,6-diaminopimelate ligase
LKLLSDILYKTDLLQISGTTDREIESIVFDSRQVRQGSLFVATKGLTHDGHDFIEKAIVSGAVAIVCQQMPAKTEFDVTYIQVADSTKALGIMASNFYDNPSASIKLVGITGTNGKTTIATLLYRLFQTAGFKSGLISTVVNKIGEENIPSRYTTPDAIELNKLFSEMVQQGCSHCFMEVSSHAIHQERVAGVKFAGGIFTNITHDHLDYHKTFSEYLNAKKTFFDRLDRNSFALTNADDKNGWVMLQNTSAKKFSYAIKNIADYKGKILEDQISGLVMQIDGRDVWCKLVGVFNASNLMAIYACARLLGIDGDEALTAISALESVEGRFDYFTGRENITGIIDYAHTPDALENVLKTINTLRKFNERIITVVGCGGNRDAAKRPVMATIAASMSDQLIITSDNPRFEDPEAIINDMKKGLDPTGEKKTLVVQNRREAIKVAASLANVGDIILVAGKGHEKYQEIEGVRYPFDDKEILREALG